MQYNFRKIPIYLMLLLVLRHRNKPNKFWMLFLIKMFLETDNPFIATGLKTKRPESRTMKACKMIPICSPRTSKKRLLSISSLKLSRFSEKSTRAKLPSENPNKTTKISTTRLKLIPILVSSNSTKPMMPRKPSNVFPKKARKMKN